MLETPGRVLARGAITEYLPNGERVEVRAEEGRDEILVLFSRELMGGSEQRFRTGSFPGWAQGSWLLTRRKDTGAGTLIRIFLRSDQFTYIQFRPFSSDKCRMDVSLYGGNVVSSLPVAVPFERLYTMPLNDVLKLAETRFPRRYFDPNPADYFMQRKFISQVRSHLSVLRFADDGAIDENGNYVYIDTLQTQKTPALAGVNCSGFLKWLIDGLLRPVTGERLSIPPLKAPYGERGDSFTEMWEERKDPHFGLDWIRNLASAANVTLRSKAYGELEEFEVRNDFFSTMVIPQKKTFTLHSYPGFLENAGYGIEGLHALLYTLAIDEPYSFYLAAINTEIGERTSEANPRGTQRLRQYFHVAALVPYFDEYGVFKVAVFESASETSFSSFKNRYPGHYISLVKIPLADNFQP